MSTSLSIAVVDDDDAVREGSVLILDRDDRSVQGFSSGEHFLDQGAVESWDVVFLDLKMPGKSGFDILRILTEGGAAPYPIIMISAHADVAAAVRAMRLGAFSFIEKPFRPEDLEDAITEATASATPSENTSREKLLDKLTPREREVAECLDRGLTNKEVASELGCSPRTVEIHRARVFEKLEVRNVAGLVRAMAGR